MANITRPVEPHRGIAFSITDHDVIRRWARTVRPLLVRLAIMFDHEAMEEALEVFAPETWDIHWLLYRTPAAIVVTDIRHAAGHEVGRFGALDAALEFITAKWTRIDAAD